MEFPEIHLFVLVNSKQNLDRLQLSVVIAQDSSIPVNIPYVKEYDRNKDPNLHTLLSKVEIDCQQDRGHQDHLMLKSTREIVPQDPRALHYFLWDVDFEVDIHFPTESNTTYTPLIFSWW